MASRKLNVGCGSKKIDGFEGADALDFGQEHVCDIRRLPMPDDAFDEVMGIHVIEHFVPGEAADALREWVRVLSPGGTIALECPDIRKACILMLTSLDGVQELPETLTHFAFWGDLRSGNERMLHRWGYSPQTLARLMRECGLTDIRQEPVLYHVPVRDMRLVGRKPGGHHATN